MHDTEGLKVLMYYCCSSCLLPDEALTCMLAAVKDDWNLLLSCMGLEGLHLMSAVH